MSVTANAIYRSDSLVLLERMNSEQVALAYLDPPWLQEKSRARSAERPKEADKADVFEERFLADHLDFLVKVYQQVHRVLAPTGVLLLHGDPALQPYTQLILNQIFGTRNYWHGFVIPQI